jgi:uncharacterized protein involved in exopolysaccharide biosynthesis
MLQQDLVRDRFPHEQEGGLDPRQYVEILKKRIFYAVVPFLLVLAIGVAAALFWPRSYLSEGKILVVSPQIPTDLVRPTVTSAANERLEILKQRVLSRDNLLRILDKYRLYPSQRQRLSRTELVDLMRENTVIKSIAVQMRGRDDTIAMTVGFTDQRPDVATKVANDLITLFLNEDARTRTRSASETTRFIAAEVDKLRSNLAAVDKKILDAKLKIAQVRLEQPGTAPDATAPPLAALRAQLALKSATFSPSHPEIKRLKAEIRALEKLDTSPAGSTSPSGVKTENSSSETLDALKKQREFVQQSLDTASAKLAAAQMGEKLERDQYAERLEVLEQAVMPKKPIAPNQKKIISFAVIAALMAAFAGIFTIETLDRTIRGSRDLLGIADEHLLLTIPYIATKAELRRKKSKKVVLLLLFISAIIIGLAAVHFFLRPLDELWPLLVERFMAHWSAF